MNVYKYKVKEFCSKRELYSKEQLGKDEKLLKSFCK